MEEREKIKNLIEDHKSLFEVTDMDVSESLKGNWLFFRYNAELNYYDTIAPIKTAKELAEVMLGELSMDIFSSIDANGDRNLDYTNLAEYVEINNDYEAHIERLIKYLGK